MTHLFSIPLDHCLVTPDFVTMDRRVCPTVGSDHCPIYVELALKKTP